MPASQGCPELYKIFTTPNASLKNQVYARIEHKIVTMQYRPGEYLNEAQISEQLDIGRTPVRQAIDQLTLEGLTDTISRKGVMVRAISIDEVRDIISVRLSMNGIEHLVHLIE